MSPDIDDDDAYVDRRRAQLANRQTLGFSYYITQKGTRGTLTPEERQRRRNARQNYRRSTKRAAL